MNLTQTLQPILPAGKQFTVFHWQSTPRETHPLVTNSGLPTVKIEHFISLAHNERIFYALEVFVYVTLYADHTEQLIFISKADTNGQNASRVSIGLVTEKIIAHLMKIPISQYLSGIVPKDQKLGDNAITRSTSTKDALKILLKRHKGELASQKVRLFGLAHHPQVTVRISLFTRSEPQYLFPDSSEHPGKHVLDGEGLLKWWLRTLDPVVNTLENYRASLRIPAEDDAVIHRYLTPLKSKWTIGDTFKGRNGDIAALKVPLFPDDPKARFLEHLCVENRAKSVSLAQFWEELGIRQEFRLGAVVAVIGIEGVHPPDDSTRSGLQCSHKELKRLKNFITGEGYKADEGSLEAYRNCATYLESKNEHYIDDNRVTGQYVRPAVQERAEIPVNNLTTLVRKKRKEKKI